MAVAAPAEAEVEWTDEYVRALESQFEDMNRAALAMVDRLDRMHNIMQDIISDLRAARTDAGGSASHASA